MDRIVGTPVAEMYIPILLEKGERDQGRFEGKHSGRKGKRRLPGVHGHAGSRRFPQAHADFLWTHSGSWKC